MYKTETHLHVSETSPCACIGAAEMVKLYHEKGYKTIFVSDHLNQRFFDLLGDINWEDKIIIFLNGYYRAKEAGKAFDMNVLMAAEVMLKDNPNHYLLYGITEEFLKLCTDICQYTLDELSKKAKEHNVFIIQAHPYRDNTCYPTYEYVDGIEVYNSNPRHQDFSEKSHELASKYNLYTTAGSDAHRNEDVGGTGIETEEEIKTAQEFIEAIKSGKARIIRG